MPYWTLLQTFTIYAQLQIYLLNFTLSILIAIFPCQIPSTYAMFYKKVSTVWYDAPRAGFSKIAPRPLLAIFLQKPKMAALCGIVGSENRPDYYFFQWTKVLLAEAEKYISPFVPFESYTKGLQRLENCFYFKKAAEELLLLSIVSP